jgi:hypothetical protein
MLVNKQSLKTSRGNHSISRSASIVSMMALVGLGLGACADSPEEVVDADKSPHSDRAGIGLAEVTQALGPGVSVDMRRSLAVTDQVILDNFTPTLVLNAIIASAGATGVITADQLFRQLWDTQNPTPGQPDLPNNAHCNDNGGILNAFPYFCRPTEGAQAAPPGALASYRAIGLFNRFDLAPSNGANCGEYRVVFARTGGGRNFVIFEAVLPNPRTDLGLEGCRPVANLWRDLSTAPTVASRVTSLQTLYFNGLPGFSPVFHINNYGATGGDGQVRTNQFLTGPWLLREFKMATVCSPACVAKFVPVTVKVNPAGNLFNPASTHAQAAPFRTHFVSQVPALAVNNVNTFNYDVPDVFNIGQSDSQNNGGAVVDDYLAQFGTGGAFKVSIQNALNLIGSTLTPEQIVARAHALSCGGCHQRSNNDPLGAAIVWPPSDGFVHNSEFTEVGPDGNRFRLSPALNTTFLPHRKRILEGYLNALRTVAGSLSQVTAVAALRGNAYFAQNGAGTVSRVSPGGSPIVLASGLSNLTGVAADNFNAFWLENDNPGTVNKASINGGGAVTVLASNRLSLAAIATDGINVYWLENTLPASIFRVPVGGGAITQVAFNLPASAGLAVDSTSLYWLEGTNVRKMPKAGGAAATIGTATAQSIATDGVRLFFGNSAANTIRTMPVAGGALTTLHTGAPSLTGVAVDATSVYWSENTSSAAVKTGPK